MQIVEGVQKLGAIDWNRRLFDCLIPLPKGTSYNSYLIKGREKTALLDTVDPKKWHILQNQLQGLDQLDYVVSHHAEQDHSGSIPMILERFPEARLVTNAKARNMLQDLLPIADNRFQIVAEGDTLELGGKTLQFYLTPWVHWPETMVSYLIEDKILFSCDFFGSHLATSRLFAGEDPVVWDAAKRYYAEIMMPFRAMIHKNLEKVQGLAPKIIAPSHGPVYDKPQFILSAYQEWMSDHLANKAVIFYISMHGSIENMVNYLANALLAQNIEICLYDLTYIDLGELAMELIDAATIIVATPTVLGGAHPNVMYVSYLLNSLHPKAKYLAFLVSFGWGGKVAGQLQTTLSRIKGEILGTVNCKGHPKADTLKELEQLAHDIHQRHQQLCGK